MSASPNIYSMDISKDLSPRDHGETNKIIMLIQIGKVLLFAGDMIVYIYDP